MADLKLFPAETPREKIKKGICKSTMEDKDRIQGWEFLQRGIDKLHNILEGLSHEQISSEDYMALYTTVYELCSPDSPDDRSQWLYDKCKESFEDYISSKVLPSLRGKHDEALLRELVERWANHKVMVGWYRRFFNFLNRYFVARRLLPTISEVGFSCFQDLVYQELYPEVAGIVIELIGQEREGHQIDRALVKNVIGIFIEIGTGKIDCYERDLEDAMLKDTAAYYSGRAAAWIPEDSCPDYMLKAEECLQLEKDRVSHYLHPSSEPKLLEKVRYELLAVYTNQLLENEHSGCRALLRDNKAEDLSRMFRLFLEIPQGLHLVAYMFKQQVAAEGTSLVGLQEQEFERGVAELLGKYRACIDGCFRNHSLFQQALVEAFKFRCLKICDRDDFILWCAGSTRARVQTTLNIFILQKLFQIKSHDDIFSVNWDK